MRRILVVALLLLAGCTASEPPPAPSPFADCAGLAAGGSELPAMELPCFEGGKTVQVGQLKGPMVLNFWASWCEPCRKELPAFQRLADQGKVTVIGVATSDLRGDAVSMASAFSLSMPTLFDATGRLQKSLGEIFLPVTVFVDGSGRVTKYVGPPLNDEKLAQLVRERLGVAR